MADITMVINETIGIHETVSAIVEPIRCRNCKGELESTADYKYCKNCSIYFVGKWRTP